MPTVTIFGSNGSFAQYFKQTVYSDVNTFDIDTHTDLTDAHTIEAIRSSQLLLFCTPYSSTKTLLTTVSECIEYHHTLVDICSVKTGLYNLAALKSRNIVSIHPLYSPKSSVEKKTCVVCGVRGKIENSKLLRHFDQTVEMTIDEHDRAMAVSQAAVHFQNYVTAHFLKQNTQKVKTQLGTILHNVLEKQLAQNPHMMAEIQLHNPHVKPTLLALKTSFDMMLSEVLKQDVLELSNTIRSIAG